LTNLLSDQPNFVDGWWLLGKVYFDLSKKYDSAAIAFDKVKALKANYSPELDYMRGQSYMYAGDYETAKKIFAELSSQKLGDANAKQVANLLQSCDFAIASKQSPKKFNPVNLGADVNTDQDELMPSVTADERFLYFTKHEKIGRHSDENIFMSELIDGKYSNTQLVDRPISTDEYFEGATCISPSGKYLFFTSCGRPDGMGDCDNYYTKRVVGGWDRPKNLGNRVNTPGWDIQPCISADGRTLYFASRRLGGMGGLDLWSTTLGDDFNWTTPVNLGPNINTEKDEERPFIHPDDKTLYFSSDGWPGFGSSDFYYAKKDAAGQWSKPVNLGFPINSPGDEIGLAITTDGKTAYMGSERLGGFGGLDIYKFELDKTVQPQHVTYIKGRVFDETTKTPLKASITLFDLDDSGKVFGTLSSEETKGEFLATIPYGRDYACAVSKEGYLFYSDNFTLKNFTKSEPFLLDIYLKKIEVGKTVVLNNIFFEVNKFELREVSITELNQLADLLNKNKTLKIELSGHTDNSGIEAENKVLSENRAKSVFSYLVSKGIEEARLSYKGYGSSHPIAENKTEEGKAKNRRTEFVVTGI
jgi:outer membrane protein OmpA-like peptidoglycan-associated protein